MSDDDGGRGRSMTEKPTGVDRRSETSVDAWCQDSVSTKTSSSFEMMVSTMATYFSFIDLAFSVARRRDRSAEGAAAAAGTEDDEGDDEEVGGAPGWHCCD